MPQHSKKFYLHIIKFMNLPEFPLCIAADGTMVDVQSFGGPYAEQYRNRQNHFSLNVQLAVSADEIILDVVQVVTFKNKKILLFKN